jgi:tellurite resistance protein TerC
LALVFDLGLLSKKNQKISIRQALYQTFFWVGLALAFFVFVWIQRGQHTGLEYISAYLMEWSLSIDNIFVFIIIFAAFKVTESDTARVLLIGVLLAIVLRIIFIAIGVELITRFTWLLYIFGAFLVYTGFQLFTQNDEEAYDPTESKVYKLISRVIRISDLEPKGRFFIKYNNKVFFTTLSLVVLMLAVTDVVFALDSIPTVVSLVSEGANKPFTKEDIMVIYSSNIFAVLGLRSLFFLLRGAASKFDYLQQGIAVVLIFIGIKMLIEFFHIHIPIGISLGVIVACLATAVFYSIHKQKKGVPIDRVE